MDERGVPLLLDQRVNNKLFVGGEVDLGLASGKKRLLVKLKIAQYSDILSDYQGQFPVISINFKDVRGSNYEEIENGIKISIKNLYNHHKYLLFSDKISLAEKNNFGDLWEGKIDKTLLKNSLRFLSELLFNHFNQKVYILIDEYDTPINSSYIKFGHKTEEFELVLELFRGMLGSALKTNPYLEKGVITGILRVAKANLFSDLNNVREYSLLDEDFSKVYGFTQIEVDELLAKVPTKTDPEKIKEWYNGYTFGGEIIYNPWSIMQCLASKGKLDHYWLDSEGTGLVDKALLSDEMQEDLQELLEGRGIVKKLYKQISLGQIEHNKDIFYSLLVFAGYL